MMMLDDITLETVVQPAADDLLAFYKRQNHATTASREKLERMIENSSCFVTAYRGGELVGFARGATDGVAGRLVECKLDPALQGPACVTHTDGRIEDDTKGIATEMARHVVAALRKSGVERIDVLAYGTEVDFCEGLGFKKIKGVVPMELPTLVEVGDPAAVSVATTT